MYTKNQLARMREINSGGGLRLTQMTTAPPSRGAGVGELFFVGDTNVNTLKLCVRAGAGGAQTTILDNIPAT